jgi:hypothetical protein
LENSCPSNLSLRYGVKPAKARLSNLFLQWLGYNTSF